MIRTLIRNARVFDGHGPALFEADVFVDGGLIVDMAPRLVEQADRVIEAAGRTLLPGLIDAHVHVYAVELDLTRAMRRPLTYIAHHASRFMAHMLETGFTTIRDAAGADVGLARALADGLLKGPRLFYGGRALSQTGGHADWRPGHESDPTAMPCACGLLDQRTAVIADGVDAVLAATREELRRGASHIKIMASGGVASPNDSIDGLQYSDEEIATIVGETGRHGAYVAAHCHPTAAIRRCAELGVRTIEHATLIDADTAAVVKRCGAFVVPTMAVIAALGEEGPALGFPAASVAKLKEIAGQAQQGMAMMRDADLPIGFGTDLIGPVFRRNLMEFDLRSDVFTPLEVMRQVTSVNARIIKQEGRLGCISLGAHADLVLVDGDPLTNLSVMTRGRPGMPMVMLAGEVLRWDG